MNKLTNSTIGLVLGVTLLAALTGCIGYVDGPGPGEVRMHAQPPPVYVESGPPADDYVYYPGYQVYYSSNRRQYMYLDGRSWVWRPTPPHVTIEALFASPSVRLDFHDSPAIHHEAVVRQYPQHWAPQGHRPGTPEHRDEGRSDGRNDGRRDGPEGGNRYGQPGPGTP